MAKMQKLETCDNCEWYDYEIKFRGEYKRWCDLKDKRVIEDYPKIPKWCPLEDYVAQKEMCEAMCKIISEATRTFKELHKAFALLAKKQKEEDKNENKCSKGS